MLLDEPLRQLLLGRSLNFCSCTTWFLDFDDSVRINRAWLYKDLKVLALQAIASVAHQGACWTWNWHFCAYVKNSTDGPLNHSWSIFRTGGLTHRLHQYSSRHYIWLIRCNMLKLPLLTKGEVSSFTVTKLESKGQRPLFRYFLSSYSQHNRAFP